MNLHIRHLLLICSLLVAFTGTTSCVLHRRQPQELRHFHTAFQAAITVTAVILISAPVWYRIGRWIRFQLKSTDTLLQEANELLSHYHYRYEKMFNLLGTTLDTTQQSAAFKQAVLDAHARYEEQEHDTLMEFLRSFDWCSAYGSVTKYPFLHYENRLKNAMGWLLWYQHRLTSKTEAQICNRRNIHQVQELLSDTIGRMRASLSQLRTSYEYLQEKNQKEQDERIKQIQASQAAQLAQQQQIINQLQQQQQQAQYQAQLPPQPTAPLMEEDNSLYYVPAYEPPPAYDREIPPPAYDGPPAYSVEDPNKRN
ncbi:hypothetical protein JW872_03075 [Candidatus Babeliales bacterium]|nr:hypothetical protein [Candidatus Babeliales bacterium]